MQILLLSRTVMRKLAILHFRMHYYYCDYCADHAMTKHIITTEGSPAGEAQQV